MHFQTLDMGEILDRLPPAAQVCTAIQLGALGQLPHLQEGLVYVAIRTDAAHDGPTLLAQMVKALPHAPQKFFISPPRAPRLAPERYWQNIWQDASTAQHDWRTAHAQV